MDAETLDQIGQLAETLDNALFGCQNFKMLGDALNLEGMTGTARQVRDELVAIYKKNGGNADLMIAAT